MTTFTKPRFTTCDGGTTAVEFAFVAPVFVMLLLGIIYGCQLIYTLGGLHYATEAAARCSSVMSTTCATSAATQAYALTKYYGTSGTTPTFAVSTVACGQQVTGTLTYVLDIAVTRWSIPLRATACFP